MRHGTKANMAVVDPQLATLSKKLNAYDAILAKQRYVAGAVRLYLYQTSSRVGNGTLLKTHLQSPTLADPFFLPMAPMLATGGIDIMTQKPNIARYVSSTCIALPLKLRCG